MAEENNFHNIQSGSMGTASMRVGSRTSSGAARVFKEFKWGLLTLFVLMAVVVGLVYDGGKKNIDQENLSQDQAQSATDYANLSSGSQPPVQPNLQQQQASLFIHNQPGLFAPPGTPGITPVPERNNATEQLVATNALTQPTIPELPTSIQALTPTMSAAPLKLVSYKVAAGDTLTAIARRHNLTPIEQGIQQIMDANKDTFNDPRKLKVGMVLKVPSPSESAGIPLDRPFMDSAQSTTSPDPSAASNESEQLYMVQAGDTLESIARKFYNDGKRWREIYNLNKDRLSDPSMLRSGQKIRIRGADVKRVADSGPEAKPTEKAVVKNEETQEFNFEDFARPVLLERPAWMP